MANISDLSGDEREQRIAELKKKMQEAAAKRAQEQAENAASSDEDTAAEVATPAAEAVAVQAVAAEALTAVEPTSESVQAESAPEEAVATEVDESTPVVDDAEPAAGVAMEPFAGNGAGAVAVAPTPTGIPAKPERTEEQRLKAEMNRREFLTYSWGAALGLLLLGSGVATFQFMYPRFKAGEFGGAFLMGPESAVPPTDAAPQAVPDGKFWWVNVEEEGPQALYMVCTHLGCLYKWVNERNQFECPCHGSKFTRDGLYIEGPAPRSLDHFVTELVDNVWVVDTGAKVVGAPASESPAAGTG